MTGQHVPGLVAGRSAHRRDAGSVILVVVVAVAFVAASVVAAGAFTAELVDRTRADTAADAAALAGASHGRSAAEAAATRNGARLVEFRRIGEDVLVTVVVGSVTAQARAGP